MAPAELAGWLATRLEDTDAIATAEVAGPGFLNLRLAADAQAGIVDAVLTAGEAYGHTDALTGQAINLEFVSANPTGPIHLGGTRWAAVGDALGRVLASQGAAVTREYYVNDAGAQIDRFAESLLAAAEGRPVPENGYGGAYVAEVAQKVLKAERRPARPARGREARRVQAPRRRGDARGDAREPGVVRHALRRLVLRAGAAQLRRGRAVGAAAQGRRRPVLRRRRVVAALLGPRRRQGPRRHQERRASGLHRGRHRLLPRQARPRRRPRDLHAGRRPPRLHPPPQGRGRGVRRRPGARRGADRPAREPRARRRSR